MVRFILVCMAVVLTTMIATGAQFVVDGIGDARTSVIARNDAQTQAQPETSVQPSGPSFEEIYANAPIPQTDNFSPDQLNALETAAGADDFAAGTFTNTAPAGLEDVPQAAPMTPSMAEIVVEEGNAN